MLVWSTPFGLPERCGGCMHQHSASGKFRNDEEEEEEEDTPNVDTWRDARVWVDFLGALH